MSATNAPGTYPIANPHQLTDLIYLMHTTADKNQREQLK